MKKKFLITLLCLQMLILTGCWNRRELNEIAIATGMAIDKTEDGQYLVTVQIVNPGEIASKQAAGARTPVTTFEAKAKSIMESLQRVTTIAPRKIYLSHLRILILGEELAKEGVGKSLEYLSRDHELRTDFYVVLSREKRAGDILKILTSLEKIPAQKLFSSLEVSQRTWAPSYGVHLDELIDDIISKGKNPVLTGITFTDDISMGQDKKNTELTDSPSRLKLLGLAVMKKDKLVGWLNEKESKGYNFIRGNVKQTSGGVVCPDGEEAVLEIIRSKTNIKGKVTNGKPQIEVWINSEANVAELQCNMDLTKTQSIEELEKIANKTNVEILQSAILKAKQLKSDIFGFGEEIHRADPKAWNKLKQNWDEEFEKLPVSIHADIKIRRTGTVSKSFLEKLKE